VFRRSLLAFTAVLAMLALVACGGGTQSPASEAPASTSTAQAAETLRIVSLSPTATESLFAIGAGDEVVAVDDQSNYPPAAPHTKLSGYEPNIEAIAGYEPDLVVASFDPGGLVDGLEKLDVTVLLQPAAKNLNDAYEQIEALGAATGHEEGARRVIEDMRTRIAALTESASASTGVTVYHEISPDYFSATSKTFIGSIYRLLGARNIADEAGGKAPDYPQLSAEYIVSADPDLIVLSDSKCCGQNAEKVASRPGWRKITAVRMGNVIPVDDDIASRWGPRTVEFVEIVARALAEASAP
jgi:iron complex transport system substrate-binding protein